MKIIKSFLLVICLFVGFVTYAQSHNTTAGSACKYAKNRCTNMEGCPQCAACSTEYKKEKDAKIAEVKSRNDKIWADAKAKKDADQKAYQAKLDADNAKRKEESGNVLINAQKTSKKEDIVKPKETEVKKSSSSMKFMVSDGRFKFHDGNGVYIESNNPNYKYPNNTFGTGKIEGTSIAFYLYPAETGIVSYNGVQNEYCNGQNTLYYDIVDYKLNTLFKDKSIHYIEHFYENWFLATNRFF